ncbi:MAG: YceI family protein [Corynebacterium sp.]|nr:YceI family protein [Corynebacterium sp.]
MNSTEKKSFIARPSTWIGLVVAIVVVIAAGFGGLKWYTAKENSSADAAFEAASSGTALEDLNGSWTIAEGSQAGYRVGKTQAGQEVVVTARTSDVTGEITIANDELAAGSEVTVDLTTVASDSAQRDEHFRTGILETDTYPTATFTTTEAVSVENLKTDGVATVTVPGTLNIHGVEKPVSIEMNISNNDGVVTVIGNSTLTWTDFGVTPPTMPGMAVHDTGDIEFSLTLEK